MIKDQEAEIKFSNGLLGQLLKDSDLFKIKQKSAFIEDRKEWVIPQFILADKKGDVSFPTINAKQRVDQLRDDRSIQFERDASDTRSQGARWQSNFHGSTLTNSVYDGQRTKNPLEDNNYYTKSDFGGEKMRNS